MTNHIQITKHIRWMSLVLLLARSALPAFAAEPEEGGYLEDDFLKTLRAAKSPYAAIIQKGDLPQFISVSKTEYGSQFVGHDNWHESYVLFTIRPLYITSR